MIFKIVVSLFPLVFLTGLTVVTYRRREVFNRLNVIKVLIIIVKVLSVILSVTYCFKVKLQIEFFRTLFVLYFPAFFNIFGFAFSQYKSFLTLLLFSFAFSILHNEKNLVILILCLIFIILLVLIYFSEFKINKEIIEFELYDHAFSWILLIFAISCIVYGTTLAAFAGFFAAFSYVGGYFLLTLFLIFSSSFLSEEKHISIIDVFMCLKLSFAFCAATDSIESYFMNKTVYSIINPLLTVLFPFVCQLTLILVKAGYKIFAQSHEFDGDMYEINLLKKTAELVCKGNNNNLIRNYIMYSNSMIYIDSFSDYCLKDYQLDSLFIQNEEFLKEINELSNFSLIKNITIDCFAEINCIIEFNQIMPQLEKLNVTDSCKTCINNANRLISTQNFDLFFVDRNSNHLTINESCLCIKTLACYQCQLLQFIVIPASIIVIEDFAFKDCIRVRNITFTKNSRLKKIGYKSFESTAIRRLTIPKSVEIICLHAFDSCFQLRKVIIPHKSKLEFLHLNSFQCNNGMKIILPRSIRFCVDNEYGKLVVTLKVSDDGFNNEIII